jgi:thiamine pyrophosphokinase
MRCAIVANGEIKDYTAAREKLKDADYIIACDGGLRHFPLLKITPNCLIGDFDSAPLDLLAAYQAQDIPCIPFPAEKDETDLALAVAHVCIYSPASIIIMGALGKRIDHTLGNVHVLAQASGIPAEIWDESTSISLISSKAVFSKQDYTVISLIPLTSEVTGITTHGLRYPLHGETLRIGEVRGISNEFTAEIAEITIASGLLLAIRSK